MGLVVKQSFRYWLNTTRMLNVGNMLDIIVKGEGIRYESAGEKRERLMAQAMNNSWAFLEIF